MSHVFKVGDKVSFGGLEGEVSSIRHTLTLSVTASFKNDTYYSFTEDGKVHPDHTEPLLKLVQPAKTKVKRALYVYKRKIWFTPSISAHYYKNDDEFKSLSAPDIEWFKRLPETEIEVEE
jgi:hypothetical protein